jgi:dihydrofolate reductase
MPRRIIGGAFVSLDGVMQAPGGPHEDPSGGFELEGWMTSVFDEALGHQVDTLFAPPFDLLLGRKTYEIFAAHWPFTQDDQGIAEAFRKCRKYVLTRSDMALEWVRSERLADLDALAALKETDGPNLVIQGSTTLYPQLLARGLLDRLVVMTAPIVLGKGKRLFGEGTPPGAFKLIEHRTNSTGVAMATYEPAGEVQTGSFGMPEPTPQELARREKWKREG